MKFNSLEQFLKKVESGQTAYGMVVNLDNAIVSEMIAHLGFDFIWFDMEHSPMTITNALHHMMALRCTGCAPFIRVPWNVNYLLKPILDLAPAGVIIPMVNDAMSAEKAVKACRYPIYGGERGFATIRNNEFGNIPIDDYVKACEKEPLVIVQIEHKEAVKNIDDILKVEGIGSICIGPYDLSASYGKTGQFNDPEIIDAIDTVREKTLAAGVMLGGFCATPFWDHRFMNWKAVGGDTDILAAALRKRLAEAQELDAQK